MTTHEVLVAARNRIDGGGHVKGVYGAGPRMTVHTLPPLPQESPPSEASDEQVRAAALAWANEFKSCRNLPKGERMMGDDCPLANATGLVVNASEAWSWDLGTIRVPPLVGEFVRRFDDQRYPDLDLDRQGE